MNVIYVNFDEKNEESFFKIPQNLDELKFFIYEQWEEEFENKGLIIENDEKKEIKNDDDLNELFKKQKNNKYVVHIKSIKNNNNLKSSFNLFEKTSNLLKYSFSKYIPNIDKKDIVDLNNDNNLLKKIQQLSEKAEFLTKEVEEIKNNNIEFNTTIKNLTNSINDIKKKLKKKKTNENIKIKVSSNDQKIQLESLLTNNSFYEINIKNLSEIPLKKGFILNCPKNKDSILYIDDYDLFTNNQLNVGEERTFLIPLIFNIEKKRYPKKTTFYFTITNNDSFEENYPATISIYK